MMEIRDDAVAAAAPFVASGAHAVLTIGPRSVCRLGRAHDARGAGRSAWQAAVALAVAGSLLGGCSSAAGSLPPPSSPPAVSPSVRPALPASASPAPSVRTLVMGKVFDARSGQMGGTTVAGATVRLLTFGLIATSDAQGGFTFWIDVPLPCLKIDVAASAPGFGPWRDNGEMISPGITTGFSINLLTSPYLDTARYGGAAADLAALCSYPLPDTSTQ